MCNLEFDRHMKTYLSPNVYSLLCEAGVCHETDADVGVSDILAEGFLNWSALPAQLTTPISSREEYAHRVHMLAPVFHKIHCHFRKMSKTEFEMSFAKYFQWTAEPSKMVQCFGIAQQETSTAVNHVLLMVTSLLERALGDVILLYATNCPSLLRDLLMMRELEELLSPSVIHLLLTLIGPPVSLNLRNVVWHGFPGPEELDLQYVYIMLCITASIGKLLEDKRIYEIPHRDMIQLTVPSVFKHLDQTHVHDVIQMFAHSTFVAPSMRGFWNLGIELYASGQYGDCIVILLPQLELALRRVFVAVNRCPDRILTAENCVLYTTLDEILCKQLPDGSENHVVSAIDKPCLMLLLDCFHYPLGPRIRDHISHGEVLLSDVSKDVAWHLVCVCIALAAKFCSCDFHMENVELVSSVCKEVSSYESVYHPISVVKQQTLLMAKSLSLWHLMPRPAAADLPAQTSQGNTDMTQAIESAFRAVENYESVLSADDKTDKLHNYQLLVLDDVGSAVEKSLGCIKLNTVYRYHTGTVQGDMVPTKEEEILRLLIRIGKLCVCISEQILDVAQNRFRLWEAKQLRSRQRTNYSKFLTCTVTVSITLRLIIVVFLTTLSVLDILQQRTAQQQKMVKFLKHVQKYCENMLSYTKTDANKWEEAETASRDLTSRVQSLRLA